MTRDPLYWNHAFATLIKEQTPFTWPWHDKRDSTTICWSRAEVRSPFTATTLSLCNDSEWESSQDLSWGFLAIIISSAGSRIRPNRKRQALASAVCYGSLTYTRWKGLLLLKHGRRGKDRNEKTDFFFPFFLKKNGFTVCMYHSSYWRRKPQETMRK